MLSRWFFYQQTGPEGQDRIEAQVVGMPCLSRIPEVTLPTHFYLSSTKDVSIVLAMSYEAWKLQERSWWRSDIPAVMPQILMGEQLVRSLGETTYLVWSRDENLMPVTMTPRVVSKELARMEASCLWRWVCHVCGQKISVQKKGGLRYDFQSWLKNETFELPSPIRPRKRSSYP